MGQLRNYFSPYFTNAPQHAHRHPSRALSAAHQFFVWRTPYTMATGGNGRPKGPDQEGMRLDQGATPALHPYMDKVGEVDSHRDVNVHGYGRADVVTSILRAEAGRLSQRARHPHWTK